MHALKMFEASALSLRGGDDPLRPDPTDEALHKVLKEGVACQVLEEAMYLSDSAGMSAIVAEDNLNASVDMGTSEMEVLRYLADAVAAGPDRDRKDILRQAKLHFGGTEYDPQALKFLLAFVVACPHKLVEMVQSLHFGLVNPAQLRMKPKGFAELAGLNPKFPYCKAEPAASDGRNWHPDVHVCMCVRT